MDVFINPYLLIENSDTFRDLQSYIYQQLGVDNRLFCRMLNAALTTKKAGIFMHATLCAFCEAPHLDEGKWAKERHSTHLCEGCHKLFFTPKRGVSNLLAVCSTRLAETKE